MINKQVPALFLHGCKTNQRRQLSKTRRRDVSVSPLMRNADQARSSTVGVSDLINNHDASAPIYGMVSPEV
jgi:hypothetical protein